MAMQITETQPPTSEEQLASLEQRMGISFPAQYRQFLLTHNGGRPKPNAFNFKNRIDPSSGSVVAGFLALYDGPIANLEYKFRTFKIRQRRMPDRLVPIALDPFGNLICISVLGNDRGAVYFWDHEEEAPDGEEADDRNVDLIADSFQEFLEGLYKA